MELSLNHVGILTDSQVKLDGLTVITGKNNSGKTTVGKVLYSLIAAGSNPLEMFDKARHRYICGRLRAVADRLQLRRIFLLRSIGRQSKDSDIFKTLASGQFRQFEIGQLLDFLENTRDYLYRLSPEEFRENVLSSKAELSSIILDSVLIDFEKRKQKALEICENTIEVINDESAYAKFIKDRITAFLNHEFKGQIKPVRFPDSIAQITLSECERNFVFCEVKSKEQTYFSVDPAFFDLYKRCIFIDDPFVADRLDNYDGLLTDFYPVAVDGNPKALITSDDIESHDGALIRLLMQGEKKDFFHNLEIQKLYGDVFSKINEIIPGEFSKTEDGVFYVEDGSPLSVANLATGSKMFFIIKRLLMNGLLDDATMLILDEPESHLHPEWINRFAEILVLLIKNINLKVLITTHSPNLMLALNVYAKKAGIEQDSHFYLAEKISDTSSQIRCIDDSIGEGYSHLSIPLVEMNLQYESLISEE